MKYLSAISDAVLDRSANELIGAVLLAVVVALIIAGLHALFRRKVSEPSTLVGGLTIVANIVCMVVAVGYVEALRKPWATSQGSVASPANRHRGPGFGAHGPRHGPAFGFWSPGFQMVTAADTDRNGRLTEEEVAQLVQEADRDGDGSVDSRDIDNFLRSRMKPPSSFVGPPRPVEGPRPNPVDQGE